MLDRDLELAHKLEDLARKVGKHDKDLEAVVEMLRQLLKPPPASRRAIGFGR